MTRLGIASCFGMILTASLLMSEPPTSRVKAHGIALSGTVSTVDEGRKSFAVRNSAGKETRLVWTNATTIVGGKLSAGTKVTLRYLDKDGKHIATSIVLGEPDQARTPAPGPAATPTSKA
jgi:hypothetical protein